MMILNFQCRTDTAIWTGGYATPPAPPAGDGMFGEGGEQMLGEGGEELEGE